MERAGRAERTHAIAVPPIVIAGTVWLSRASRTACGRRIHDKLPVSTNRQSVDCKTCREALNSRSRWVVWPKKGYHYVPDTPQATP